MKITEHGNCYRILFHKFLNIILNVILLTQNQIGFSLISVSNTILYWNKYPTLYYYFNQCTPAWTYNKVK